MDRHSTLLHIISAAAVVVAILFEVITGEAPGSYFEPMFIFGVFGALSLVAAILLSMGRKARDEAAKRYRAERDATLVRMDISAKKINEILAIDFVHCRYIAELACEERPRDTAFVQEVRGKLNDYIVEILSQTTALFTAYTGDQCAASVKILSADRHERGTPKAAVAAADSPRYVYTYARDPHSRIRRSVTDRMPGLDIYEWAEHAAFAEVMHSPEQHGYYCANDLQRLGAKYWNINKRWRELYNSIAVCALKNPASENVVEAMGFLCVDNMRGGFDTNACRELLESVASIVYYTFIITEEVINSEAEVKDHG